MKHKVVTIAVLIGMCGAAFSFGHGIQMDNWIEWVSSGLAFIYMAYAVYDVQTGDDLDEV
jgi:hypothetical protein